MTTYKKTIYGILMIVVILIVGATLFILNSTKNSGSVKTMACYDHPNNVFGKHGLPIPCSKDSECDLFNKNVVARMKEFCSPAEVGFYKCGFKDFCGDDGYCKHDCSLGAKSIQELECAKEGEQIGSGVPPNFCCPGLKPVVGWQCGNSKADPQDPQWTSGLPRCVNCGDNICDTFNGENKCNCPEDCTGNEPPCVSNSAQPVFPEEICCKGLKKIKIALYRENCSINPKGPPPTIQCMPCGDGYCFQGVYRENKCNCPKDCK